MGGVLKQFVFLVPTVVFLLFVGCQQVEERVSDRYVEVTDSYLGVLVEAEHPEPESLSWLEANKLLNSNNIDLRRAQLRHERAQRQKTQIFKDLLPSLRLSANLTKSLGELERLSSEDLRFSVFSFVNIPGLVSLRSRYYAATLAELSAGLDYEILRRQKRIELRDLFISYGILSSRLEHVDLDIKTNSRTGSLYRELQSTPESLRREQQSFDTQIAANALQERLREMLGGSPGITWRLDASTIPELPYATEPLDLQDSDRVGVLLRNGLAVDLEALRIQEIGALLPFFPDLRLGLSAPPLYRVSGGESRSFDAEQIRLRFSSDLNVDTTGRLRNRLRDVRETQKLQREIIEKRLESEVQRAIIAQDELGLVARELQIAELRLEILNSEPSPTDTQDLRLRIERRTVLLERIGSLRRQKATLEGAFWLIDDAWWDEYEI